MKEHEGWGSVFCTKGRCRKALDYGAGNQFRDENGDEQRYCWEHWVKYIADPKLGIGNES